MISSLDDFVLILFVDGSPDFIGAFVVFNVTLCKKLKIFFRVVVANSILCCNLAETKRSKVMNKTEIKLNEKNLKDGFTFFFTNEEEGHELDVSFFNLTNSFHLWNNCQLKGVFKSFNGLKKALDKKIKEQNLEFIEAVQ